MSETYREYPRAIVTEVHDGDTITVDFDLGFDLWLRAQKLRLEGLNAPELETLDGKVSQSYLATIIPVGSEVHVLTKQVKDKDQREKYGRWLAVVFPLNAFTGDNHDSVNQLLIRTNHAKAWDGKGERPV